MFLLEFLKIAATLELWNFNWFCFIFDSGNLVTPSWWTDLWLNEGFASYVEYLGVEAIQPELKLLEQFVTHDLQARKRLCLLKIIFFQQDVFRIDALESSHPISIPVKHPAEISEIFDRISYGKGASIIRMMDKFLTTDTFRQVFWQSIL